MDYVSDASELVRQVRAFAFSGAAPADIENRLQTIPGVEADLLTEAAEMLYAHFDLLNEQGRELVGKLFYHADQQRWTTFNRDGRSAAIVALVRRDLGENGTGVGKASDTWPEPEANRRDGVDWRDIIPVGEAPTSDAA